MNIGAQMNSKNLSAMQQFKRRRVHVCRHAIAISNVIANPCDTRMLQHLIDTFIVMESGARAP